MKITTYSTKISARLRILIILTAVILLNSCTPGGGDFTAIPLENSRIESAYGKKGFVQIYDNQEVSFRIWGVWLREYGGADFFAEISNRTQNDLIIDVKQLKLQTTLDKSLTFSEVSKMKSGSPLEKIQDGKITVGTGKTESFNISFYIPELGDEIKPFDYFIGNEVHLDFPLKFGESEEEIYKFAFKYDYAR